MKIGARIVKTGVAVATAIYLCKLLKVEPSTFAAISALLNVQPSVHQSLKKALEQVLVHIIGVGLAFSLGYFLGANPLSIGLGTIILIWLLLTLNLSAGITMGVVALVFILASAPREFVPHAVSRSAAIFIGLGVGLAINPLLAPPRYKDKFLAKLEEFSRATVAFFAQSVEDFARLVNPDPRELEEKYRAINKLAAECNQLWELYHHDLGLNLILYAGSRQDARDYSHWEAYLKYTTGLMERGMSVYELIPYRIKRRESAGDPPLSQEYQSIVNLLLRGSREVIRLNDRLVNMFFLQEPLAPIPINETYWDQVQKAIDRWHGRFSGSYYLHALMEVSVVAHEIRWAAREAKALMNQVFPVATS